MEIENGERSAEIESTQRPIVVILDDNLFPYENLLSSLSQNDFCETITPLSKSDASALRFQHLVSDQEKRLQWQKWRDAVWSIDLSRVTLVIADQFRNHSFAREGTCGWIGELKRVNEDAVVIETSFSPIFQGIYKGDNSVMETGSLCDLHNYFRSLKIKDKKELIEFGERLGNLAFRETQKADPNNAPDYFILKRGYGKLLEHNRYCDLIEEITENDEQADLIEAKLWDRRIEIDSTDDLTQDGLILHTAFMIIAHLEWESDPSFYSIAITRLRSYLGIEDL